MEDGSEELREAFKAIDVVVRSATLAAAQALAAEAVGLVQSAVKDNVDDDGHRGRIDRGSFVQSIEASEPQVDSTGVSILVGARPPENRKSAVIEDGRMAGRRMPPREEIEGWVRRKLGARLRARTRGARVKILAQRVDDRSYVTSGVQGVSGADFDREVKSVAFLVQRKIGREGTPGIHPFRTARLALLDGNRASLIVTETVSRFLRNAGVAR